MNYQLSLKIAEICAPDRIEGVELHGLMLIIIGNTFLVIDLSKMKCIDAVWFKQRSVNLCTIVLQNQ